MFEIYDVKLGLLVRGAFGRGEAQYPRSSQRIDRDFKDNLVLKGHKQAMTARRIYGVSGPERVTTTS